MDRLYDYLDTVSQGGRLTRGDKNELSALFEDIYPILETGKAPAKFRLVTDELARGATGRTALTAYLLLLARKSFGKEYARKDPRLQRWSQHTAFHIMRSNFVLNQPKGVYCCVTCTLSVLPLYATDAFHWLECDALTENVLSLLEKKQSVFKHKYSQKYADWALRFVS